MKIRVVFLVRSLGYGGMERQLLALARGMDPLRFDVTIVCFYGGGALLPEFERAGLTVEILGKGGRWDIVTFLSRLIKTIQRFEPDIVHAFLPVPNFLAALLKLAFPRLRVVMGVRTSGKDLRQYDWTFRLSFWLEKLFSGLADLVIVNSLAGKTAYEKKGFNPHKLLVISNGVDTTLYRPEPQSGTALRQAWGVSESGVLVGIIGRLDPMKGYQVFLQAAACLAGEFPELHLVCVGDGPQDFRRKLEELSVAYGLQKRLIWEKPRPEVAAVYNALDICCSASVFGEGFPNVVGEAMACGKPCVVTDVGDSARVVGETGKVVPPDDIDALAQALRAMILLPVLERLALGEKACHRILANFSIQRMISETENALAVLGGDRV
jgi:glycosyltransferase involved in cell wall biosynthesis